MTLKLEPPSKFPFHQPDEWQRWKRRFEQFRLASGLNKEDDERQVSTLLYTMGEEAEDTLMSTNITEESRAKYDDVIAKFDSFFQVRKNVIFERARFNRRSQREDETAEQFITGLYQLSENCEYGELRNQMIRDRIVVGIRNGAMSQKLQLDPKLTLEKAKTMVRQHEAVQEQQAQLKGGFFKESLPVETVGKSSKASKPSYKTRRPQPTTQTTTRSTQSSCSRCGKGQHFRQNCPAKEATCRRCGKRGHYQAKCFTKLNEVTEAPQEELRVWEDPSYLDTLSKRENSTYWSVMVAVNQQSVTFKVDTGAEVSKRH